MAKFFTFSPNEFVESKPARNQMKSSESDCRKQNKKKKTRNVRCMFVVSTYFIYAYVCVYIYVYNCSIVGAFFFAINVNFANQ